jgi:hypothetical protein
MTPKNDVGLEIQRSIQAVNRCFCSLRKHLWSSHLARQFTIYKTLICPDLLYGSETLVLTKKEENRLLVKNSRWCVYRSRYKIEVDREFNSPNVIGVVIKNKLRYTGHMIIRGAEDLP